MKTKMIFIFLSSMEAMIEAKKAVEAAGHKAILNSHINEIINLKKQDYSIGVILDENYRLDGTFSLFEKDRFVKHKIPCCLCKDEEYRGCKFYVYDRSSSFTSIPTLRGWSMWPIVIQYIFWRE